MTFATPLVLTGPLRKPAQMLQHQEYGGHSSIHDDSMAEKLGFRAGPIEGPTHFSLYPPLLGHIFGEAWFTQGCISAHYENMVVEGEETRAFAEVPGAGATRTNCWVEKADGTRVQTATASIGPNHGETLLEERLKALRPPGKLVILRDLKVGMTTGRDEAIRMDPDQNMGALYPFSLNEKLAKITENSDWYSKASPWGRPIVPLEMVSVLAQYSSRDGASHGAFPVRGPSVGLFADQEIRMIDGPLFVGEDYIVRREIAALSESKRTESYWVRTRIFDKTGKRQVAEMLLNHANMKQSFKNYDAERAELEKAG